MKDEDPRLAPSPQQQGLDGPHVPNALARRSGIEGRQPELAREHVRIDVVDRTRAAEDDDLLVGLTDRVVGQTHLGAGLEPLEGLRKHEACPPVGSDQERNEGEDQDDGACVHNGIRTGSR